MIYIYAIVCCDSLYANYSYFYIQYCSIWYQIYINFIDNNQAFVIKQEASWEWFYLASRIKYKNW